MGDKHRIGAAQSLKRFAEQAAREDPIESEWLGCMDDRQFKIPPHTPMLHRIIQNEQRYLRMLDQRGSGGLADSHGYSSFRFA